MLPSAHRWALTVGFPLHAAHRQPRQSDCPHRENRNLCSCGAVNREALDNLSTVRELSQRSASPIEEGHLTYERERSELEDLARTVRQKQQQRRLRQHG